MEALGAIGAAASILSLFVSLFVAVKVVQLGNAVGVKGQGNVTAGRDATVGKK